MTEAGERRTRAGASSSICAPRPELVAHRRGGAAIRAAAPPGWSTQVVASPTSSDGDGGRAPSDEAMRGDRRRRGLLRVRHPRALFAPARQLRWVHSAAAGVGSAAVSRDDATATSSSRTRPASTRCRSPSTCWRHAALPARSSTSPWQQQRARSGTRAFVGERDARARARRLAGADRRRGRNRRARSRGDCRRSGARCIGIRRRPELGAPAASSACRPRRARRGAAGADILVLAAPRPPRRAD